MKSRYVCTWSANVGDINRNKLRFGYSGMRFQIRVSIQGSGTRISGYPLRSLDKSYKRKLANGLPEEADDVFHRGYVQSVSFTGFIIRLTEETKQRMLIGISVS